MAGRGVFITLEGGEGGGKSTQARMLCAALAARGVTVVATREPGGTEGAEAIRKLIVDGATERWDAMTEALLLFAARRDHLERKIRPALARGEWVVSDRFGDSTMAYQGYAHGLGREAVETLASVAIGGFAPDITLILDMPVEEGLDRAHARGTGEDRFERMGGEFHRRLRDGFLDIARREPHRCAVIDAARTPEAVHADILAAIAARFPLPGAKG